MSERKNPIHFKYDLGKLRQMQAMPLNIKIDMIKLRIRAFYESFNGDVFVSFSGGKDSTVLLDIARKIYPEIKAVFADTGLEYPAIREFVKTVDNVDWVKPEMNFKQIIKEYGYPVISKDVARTIYYARKGSKWALNRINGIANDGQESQFRKDRYEKYKNLINAPFDISHRCCDFIKKKPIAKYEKQTGRYPILGTLAEESKTREESWMRTGCNSFEGKIHSTPIAFWTNQDILMYLKQTGIKYCEIYGEIEENPKTGKLETTAHSRTGCMYCAFGAQCEKSPNRYELMKEEYPELYQYIMKPVEEYGLGLAEVLDWLGIKR